MSFNFANKRLFCIPMWSPLSPIVVDWLATQVLVHVLGSTRAHSKKTFSASSISFKQENAHSENKKISFCLIKSCKFMVKVIKF